MATDSSPNHAFLNRLVQTSTNTTATVQPSSVGIPGYLMATAADIVFRFPLEHMQDRVAFHIITDAASSVANYLQVDVRYANTTDPGWMGKGYGITSTVDAAFKSFISTAVIGTVTASQAVGYMLAFDSAPYACNFGGTSSAITDKYENFIELTCGQSTKATIGGHNAVNAIISTGVGYYVGMFSIPR